MKYVMELYLETVILDRHRNSNTEEINFCPIFWTENSVLICTECSDSLPGSYQRHVVRFYNLILNQEIIQRLK